MNWVVPRPSLPVLDTVLYWVLYCILSTGDPKYWILYCEKNTGYWRPAQKILVVSQTSKCAHGGAKLILCLMKPGAGGPVRTNESQTSNNVVNLCFKQQTSDRHTHCPRGSCNASSQWMADNWQTTSKLATDVDTSLKKKVESKQIERRIGSWICQTIAECELSMNLQSPYWHAPQCT